MKKIVSTLIILLVMMTMVGPINAEEAVVTEASFLEKVFEEPEIKLSVMNLKLQNIEIKGQKDWSGELAIVYEKTIDSVIITDEVQTLYSKDQEDWNKQLIKEYGNLHSDFEKKISLLEKDMEVPFVREALLMLSDYISMLKSDAFLTIDMEIQQASMLSQAFADAFKTDFTNYDESLRNKVVAVERLKNLDLQQIIDELNAAKISYEKAVFNLIEEEVKLALEAKYAPLLTEENELTFKKVGSNEKELFVVIKFKDLTSLHPGFTSLSGKNLTSLGEEQQAIIEGIEADYLQSHQQEPEVTAAAEYMLDVINKSQKMMTITLETQGQRILQQYNSTLDELIKEKEVQPDTLIGKKIAETIEALKKDLNAYKLQAGKIIDDSEQVDKVLDLIGAYDEQVIQLKEDQLTQDQLQQEFRDYTVFVATFSNPLPVEIRLTIEGKFVLKNLANGQLDSKSNYYYNMQSSGENAMRLYSSESSFLGFYEASTVSSKAVKIGFGIYGLILFILFFVQRDWFKNILIANVLLVISFIVIYPLAWVIGASLNNSTSLGSVGISPFPKQFTLIQYERLFLTTDYGKWFFNSFKIAVSNMLITVSLAVTAAYVFSRFKFKGKKIGLMTMLIIQIFPSFSAMVAIYTLLANVKFLEFITGETSLVNTHLGLILVYCAGQIPYNTWLVKGYFDTLPMSMDEAARIDGASNMQAFLKIILPLGRPIIAFVAVTSFMAPWMDFILPRLLLKSTEKKTLAVGLFEMINGQSNNNFTMFAAGAVLVAVPITLMYAYFQKYIVKGLASGAVKG